MESRRLLKTILYTVKMREKIRIVNYKSELESRKRKDGELLFEGTFKDFLSKQLHSGYASSLIENSYLCYGYYSNDILILGICMEEGDDKSYFIMYPDDYKN